MFERYHIIVLARMKGMGAMAGCADTPEIVGITAG